MPKIEPAEIEMKPQRYRPIRMIKPKRKGNISTRKSLMFTMTQKWKPITSPELREEYFTKTEWATKTMPELKKEAETPEEKEKIR